MSNPALIEAAQNAVALGAPIEPMAHSEWCMRLALRATKADDFDVASFWLRSMIAGANEERNDRAKRVAFRCLNRVRAAQARRRALQH